jgi:folate-dependent phosphoribosylglycinamide formyltransferase PurN
MSIALGDMPDRGPVVVLVSGGPMAWCVVNALRARWPDVVVLVEEPETKWAIVRRRARLLGWLTALGQAAGGVAHKLLAKASGRRIAAICAHHGLDTRCPVDVPVYRIGSVNSEACLAKLGELAPSVVAVYGTRIIRREILRATEAPFINYHAGINPKYRGQHPGYWALVQRDAEHAGVTIHVVDEGIDTGDILYQARVSFEASDNISTYQWRQMVVALPLFADAITDARLRRLRPYKVDLPTRQHFPPTLWAYAWYGVTRGVW